MTYVTMALGFCLLVSVYVIFQIRRLHFIEQSRLRYANHLAYTAITELRDVVHGIGWSSHLSMDFSAFQQYIEAADALGKSAFNSVARDPDFSNEDIAFAEELTTSGSRKHLASFDLGELNGRRDELLDSPNLVSALKLLGALMQKVLHGVNRNLQVMSQIAKN